MLIWFAATSVVLVAIVFRSPGVDYRYVVAGSLVPLVEVFVGGPRLLHSVVGAVALLGIVVAATRSRRLLRRKVLGIPIGMMAHLVLDGSFATTKVFFWPLAGVHPAVHQIPEASHLALSLVLELAGFGVAAWGWRLFGLADPGRRRRFLAEGRLDLPG